MKKYLTLLAFLPLAAFISVDWQTFSVDDQVSVKLPIQPTEADLSKMLPPDKVKDTRVFVAKDPYGLYQIIKTSANLSVESAALEESRQSFNKGMINGLLRNQQGTLISVTPFATSVGEGIEVKFRGITKATGKQVIKLTRSLLVGNTSYSFNFVPVDQTDSTGSSGNEQRRRFFDSIAVKALPVSGK